MGSIYLGNLSPSVDASLLEELVSHIAPSTAVRMPSVNGANKGFAFVDFADSKDAEYTLKILKESNLELYKRPLKVSWASNEKKTIKEAKETGVQKRLFIKNLDPALLTKETLAVPLRKLGTVNELEILKNGCALITMSTPAETKNVLSSLNGQYILNQQCVVEYEIINN